MGRSPCCDKVGLKKGPWTPEEDQKLMAYIQEHGHGSWRALPAKAGLQRCGKSCRLRWTNYLRPDIKRGKFSLQEEQTIIQLHALLGNRWSAIASHLPKRTDNEIKNYWNTHLKKRLTKMGIDPMTHKPKNHALGCGQPKDAANLSHMAQWESARLEAEARIVRESKMVSNTYHSLLSNKAATSAPPSQPETPRPPCLDVLKVWQGSWAATKPGRGHVASTMMAHGFAPSNGSLESPTSILNFSENMLSRVPRAGWIHENSLPQIDYVGNHDACAVGKVSGDYHLDGPGEGIMENSLQLHDMVDPVSSTQGFPSFLEGCFVDLPVASIDCRDAGTAPAAAVDDDDDVYEDNKISYWNNILNVVSSPMDSPVF